MLSLFSSDDLLLAYYCISSMHALGNGGVERERYPSRDSKIKSCETRLPNVNEFANDSCR